MTSRRPLMHAWIAGVSFLSALAGSSLAQSSILLETAYVPTSTIVSGPMATTSLLPTAYVVPTAYTPSYLFTSYLAPTSYVTTTRYRRPRRFVERTSYFASPSYALATSAYLSPTSYVLPTSYLATSSYVPTTYISSSSLLPTSYVSSSSLLPTAYVLDSGLIATSASVSAPICCESSPAPAPVQATTIRRAAPPADTGSATGTNAITSKPTGTSTERNPSASMGDPTPEVRDSSVKPTPVAPSQAPQQQPPPKPVPADSFTPPYVPPAEDKDPNQMPLPKPGALGDPNPRANETMYRTRKPATYPEVRNILKGRVVAYDSRRPEEGVTVVVSSLNNTFSDRTAMSDADGEFKLSLPEGDWTVKVQMPSGRIAAVGREYVTATSGRVTDSSGRNVKELVITR